MEKEIVKEYTNGEVTVVWKPSVCIHSALCFKGLPPVFDPRKRPWVTPQGGTTAQITAQVDKCPSGALSYYHNAQLEEPTKVVDAETIVEVSANGPLLVYGNVKIRDAAGNEVVKNKVTAFCRCGASANKPYCDGTHNKIGFAG
jgi:uncharacterized Fe-S cluster protein YjdI